MNYASDERLDCLIRLALVEHAAKEVENIKAMDTSGVVCPAKVDRRIHRMIARKAREASARKTKRILFRVMVAALIVMSLTLVLLMSVAGIREAIWKALVDWYDGYVAVRFVPEEGQTPKDVMDSLSQPQEQETTPPEESTQPQDTQPSSPEPSTPAVTPPEEILEYKKPGDLPIGYEGNEVFKGKTQFVVEYTVGEEWSFTFVQVLLRETEKWYDDTGKLEIKQTTINGMEAVVLLSDENNTNMIAWHDGIYSYSIDGFLTEAELISFAKSVT